MTERAIPTPEERTRATRLCARLGIQPTEFPAEEWFEIALKSEPMNMPKAYPGHDYLEMAVLAERFPGATFY